MSSDFGHEVYPKNATTRCVSCLVSTCLFRDNEKLKFVGQLFAFDAFHREVDAFLIALDGTFNSSGVFTATLGTGQAWINPEPGTYALFITGLAGIAGIVRKNLKI